MQPFNNAVFVSITQILIFETLICKAFDINFVSFVKFCLEDIE